MDAATPQQITELLRAINELKGQAMVFIALLLSAGLIYLISRRYLTLKKERYIEQCKQDRANQYTKSFDGLSGALTDHTVKEDLALNKINGTMIHVGEAIGKVETCMSALLMCQTGAINSADSRRLCRDRFNKDIKRAIIYICEKSLTDNDFANRREFVIRKVKSAIGDVLASAKEDLAVYNLAIEADSYFMQTKEHGVVRFTLCDEIWEEVEALYTQHTDIKQRLEEMNVIISNVVKDYITRVETGVRDKTPSRFLPSVEAQQ